MASVSSMSSGMTNAVKDVLGLSITFLSYEWMVSRMALYPTETSILDYNDAMFFGF
jgi:hypothetical protein